MLMFQYVILKLVILADLSKTIGCASATSKNEIIEEVRQNIPRNGATKTTTTERRLEDLDHCNAERIEFKDLDHR